MYKHLKYGQQLKTFVDRAEKMTAPLMKRIDDIAEENQFRVLQAFRNNQVSDYHFTPSTGYGYDDIGRDTLEQVYAEVFGAEAAIVRSQMMSGTHAIALALYGVLRPGDELLYITGEPYDTLHEVIGLRGRNNGSLIDFGIRYNDVPLTEEGVDYEKVKASINENTKVIGIQRSKGYTKRPAFTIEDIKEMTSFVKSIKEDVIVFVDNCYGEFVEEKEPCHVNVDLIAGSLIKNPGGGIVKTGGYIAGRKELVNLCAQRFSAPGVGAEIGATLYSLLEMFQGFFLAPFIVAQALKGAIFTSAMVEQFGYEAYPKWNEKRGDLVQSVQFKNADEMITFCQAIQYASPINAHVTPYPSEMPGYDDEVIMAAGAFIQGSSIELSADGPIRPPYIAYVQGGLTYSHVKIAILHALDLLAQKGYLSPFTNEQTEEIGNS
ncbi:aminotransferase class I/II-fold pyridoxal phosphate-dependent enzyme [Pueribacillus sp. YX66]|uniref:methionine gamma-lyase family protein n=1 Tax=Pueribacillus sp. YX66 TaxID=3229242 RepID=UPI00358D089C